MIFRFTDQAEADYQFFKKSGNKQIVKKIKELLTSIDSNPFTGLGQPEPLKHELSGAWSRRVNREHRLVYEVKDDIVFIISIKGHY